MFLQASKFPGQALAGIALGSLAAVAAALAAQYGFGVKPCAWCVMQRGVFLLIALVAALGWLFKSQRLVRRSALLVLILLGLAGLAAAYYQHDVASKLASCDMTLADRINSALNLEALLPSVFMVTASCSDAAQYRLLALPYEFWSGVLFLLISGISWVALNKR
jgi:disulfide bond formation protein DsbB